MYNLYLITLSSKSKINSWISIISIFLFSYFILFSQLTYKLISSNKRHQSTTWKIPVKIVINKMLRCSIYSHGWIVSFDRALMPGKSLDKIPLQKLLRYKIFFQQYRAKKLNDASSSGKLSLLDPWLRFFPHRR